MSSVSLPRVNVAIYDDESVYFEKNWTRFGDLPLYTRRFLETAYVVDLTENFEKLPCSTAIDVWCRRITMSRQAIAAARIHKHLYAKSTDFVICKVCVDDV